MPLFGLLSLFVNVTWYFNFWSNWENSRIEGLTITETPGGEAISTLNAFHFLTIHFALQEISHLSICVIQTAEISPGSLALDGLTCPAPIAKMLAGRSLSSKMGSLARFTVLAVVMIADLIAAGDQVGCVLFSNAATPLRCGQDIEVPDIMLKVDFVFVLLSMEVGQAARMLRPGPIISGFKIPGLAILGPLEENAVTTGASLSPIISRKDMSIGRYSETIISGTNDNHANTSGILYSLSFYYPRKTTTCLAHNNFAFNFRVTQSTWSAIRSFKVTVSPSNNCWFPSLTVALSFLSIVLAPTVRIHGASFDKVLSYGPLLPAEQLTRIPLCAAL
ncbi:hypothetical protein H5410_039406 [Solanum commersonii]|uniref:Uncharacterized protein n=1 Tax=Solanum commersonii TaxID=4109 RepID=A0A9J5XNG9_SOLCO|nr:hypothetical protein H5410_039406 [Solanum commersonii]